MKSVINYLKYIIYRFRTKIGLLFPIKKKDSEEDKKLIIDDLCKTVVVFNIKNDTNEIINTKLFDISEKPNKDLKVTCISDDLPYEVILLMLRIKNITSNHIRFMSSNDKNVNQTILFERHKIGGSRMSIPINLSEKLDPHQFQQSIREIKEDDTLNLFRFAGFDSIKLQLEPQSETTIIFYINNVNENL
jgi:hypothetical protein